MSKRTSNCWVIVPVKASGGGKTRLSGVLGSSSRNELVTAMLDRVIEAAQDCQSIDRICIVNNTPSDRWGRDVLFLSDPDMGLNPALQSALVQVGHGASESCKPDRVIIVAGDLPFIRPIDFAMLARVSANTIRIAPDRHGTGTNALSLPGSVIEVFEPRFGLGSHLAHRAEAARHDCHVETIISSGLAKDIDEPVDLRDAQDCLQEAH